MEEAPNPRIFTLEEANALLPALQLELGGLARLRTELEQSIQGVGGADAALAVLHGGTPPPGTEPQASHLRELADEIAAAVQRVSALGCVLKDVDSGLVDFYALRDEEPVFLCWQLGEPAVAHWHTLDGGFAARQPIEGIEIEPPKFPN